MITTSQQTGVANDCPASVKVGNPAVRSRDYAVVTKPCEPENGNEKAALKSFTAYPAEIKLRL